MPPQHKRLRHAGLAAQLGQHAAACPAAFVSMIFNPLFVKHLHDAGAKPAAAAPEHDHVVVGNQRLHRRGHLVT